MTIDPNNLQGTAHATFSDDFNSLSLWNGTAGTWSTTFWYQDPKGNGGSLPSNGEQEWYVNANDAATSSVKPWTDSNGILTITAAPASAPVSANINGYGYTSGEINTYHSFSQTYGYFEMRAELPAGQGFWPAFWLLPENGAWPPELDVMEVLGNNTSVLYNTVHTAELGYHTAAGDGGVTVADMSSGYHTYGVDWEPNTITFYFDGQAIYSTATPSDMNSPMYMIANLAAGGNWPGAVTPGSTGQMNIDYIRAYASGGDGSAVAPAAPGAPAAGQTFNSDNAGDHWTGTSASDTFNLGRGGDVVTGGGGADVFKVAETPWAGSHITDFGSDDRLDLTGLLAHSGYTGSDPVGAGYLKITADAAGEAQVWSQVSGAWWLVTTLDGVPAANVHFNGGVLTLGAATGSAPAPAAGQTFTSDNGGDHWTGTAGNDVFSMGRGGDVVTGGGGADTFKFAEVPWAAGHITDFGAGDVLDLSAMFARYGETGSNPLQDGHLQLTSDGQGGTEIVFDMDGLPAGSGSWVVTTLDHVSASSLSFANGQITDGSAPASSAAPPAIAGQTFTSDNAGDHWTGTAGNDTFNVGRGGDVITGGNDSFVFNETPWAAAHITDFHAGDQIDLSVMLAHAGYTGSDPVGAGYLKIDANAAGDAQVWSHLDSGWWLAATLDHVAPTSVHLDGAFITG